MNGWKKCNKKSLLKIWCIKIAKHNAFPVGLFPWQGSFLPNLRTTAKEMFFPHCPILKLITTRIWDLIIVKISLYCDNQRVLYFLFVQNREVPSIIYEPEVHGGPVRTCSETNLEQRHISFQERLTKTHPIWYLPDIGRSGAVHLLKDREPGVRESNV